MRREDRLREFMEVGRWYTLPEILEGTGMEANNARRCLGNLEKYGLAERGPLDVRGPHWPRLWRIVEAEA